MCSDLITAWITNSYGSSSDEFNDFLPYCVTLEMPLHLIVRSVAEVEYKTLISRTVETEWMGTQYAVPQLVSGAQNWIGLAFSPWWAMTWFHINIIILLSFTWHRLRVIGWAVCQAEEVDVVVHIKLTLFVNAKEIRWRIQDFPDGGGPALKEGWAPAYYLAMPKTAWN